MLYMSAQRSASTFLRTSGFNFATSLDQLSTAAAGRVVQTGRHPVSSLVHPKLSEYDRVQAIYTDTDLV